MKNYQITCQLARKKCLYLTKDLLKVPLKVALPMKGVTESEVSYYGWTTLTLITFPKIEAVKLTGQFSTLILPMMWNYLDAACAITIGVNELMDEDNYRQTECKIKGMLNIISGIQLFVFTYNPALVAAVGLTGAPLAFAGCAFALAALIDVLTAAIDLCSAAKELKVENWMEEKQKEYEFIVHRIRELESENELFNHTLDPLDPDPQIQWALDKNQQHINELTAKNNKLKEDLVVRATVHSDKLTVKNILFLKDIDPLWCSNSKASTSQEQQDAEIQRKIDKKYDKARTLLLTRATSFVGMTLLAVGTFALFTTCPYAVAAVGLALTLIVSAMYLYKHQHALSKYIDKLFKEAKPEELEPPKQEEAEAAEEEEPPDSPFTPSSP